MCGLMLCTAACVVIAYVRCNVSIVVVFLHGQVQWEAKWEDEGRRRWHESKMASKVERADKQITALGVQKGLVDHLG